MLIFSKTKHPFYIVTPPYTRTSAGIRCLHLLCHCLNLRGQSAYLLLDPASEREGLQQVAGADLLTPFLTDAIAQTHFDEGRTPIVLYSETLPGNPYEAPCVVRFVAHFPGFLGGDRAFGTDELCYGFSRNLAESAGVPENVLFIPSIDTTAYRPPEGDVVRKGSCFYADKFRKVHGGKPHAVTADSLEIKRQEPGEQSLSEIVRLLQTSEAFYTYENTALAIEAVLCGCPAVFIPNPWLTEIISDHELGREGYAWGTDPDQIAWARATVEQGAANYRAKVASFWPALDRFIERSSAHADRYAYTAPVFASRFQAKLSASDHFLLAISHALPPRPAREFAKFVSTCGFRRAGSMLWNEAAARLRFAGTFAAR